MSWFSDKRSITLFLCGSFLLFALVATSPWTDDADTAADFQTTPAANQLKGAGQDVQTAAPVERPYTAQGVYVLLDTNRVVRYVGRGNAYERVSDHADSPDKGHLYSTIVWPNNLTWAEMMGLEQRLMDFFGGAQSDNPRTPLLNKIRNYSRGNPRRAEYEAAVTEELWKETLKRLELEN